MNTDDIFVSWSLAKGEDGTPLKRVPEPGEVYISGDIKVAPAGGLGDPGFILKQEHVTDEMTSLFAKELSEVQKLATEIRTMSDAVRATNKFVADQQRQDMKPILEAVRAVTKEAQDAAKALARKADAAVTSVSDEIDRHAVMVSGMLDLLDAMSDLVDEAKESGGAGKKIRRLIQTMRKALEEI